jgi:hypothetical protein
MKTTRTTWKAASGKWLVQYAPCFLLLFCDASLHLSGLILLVVVRQPLTLSPSSLFVWSITRVHMASLENRVIRPLL